MTFKYEFAWGSALKNRRCARALVPMYEPLRTSKCKKCGKVIAEPKELIRILKGKA